MSRSKIKIWVSCLKREVRIYHFLSSRPRNSFIKSPFCVKTWNYQSLGDFPFSVHLDFTHHQVNLIFFFCMFRNSCCMPRRGPLTLITFLIISTQAELCHHGDHWGYIFRCLAKNCQIGALTFLKPSNFSNKR